MADQDNSQFGGQGVPVPGGQGAGGGFSPPVPGGVPPVSTPGIIPMPVPGGVPPMPMPSAPAPMPVPSAPAEPKKPMTLEDLAKQTPIFSDEELDEDDFDPWAPLDDSKRTEEEAEVPSPPTPPVSKPDPVLEVKPAMPAPELEAKPVSPKVEKQTEEVSDDMEVVEGSVLNEEEIDPFDGIEEEDESPLKQFFANANINGKKVVGCAVAFILIIAIIIGLFYGGKALFKFLTADKPDEVTVEEVVKEETSVEESTQKNTEDFPAGWIEPSLYTGIKLGFESAEGSDSAMPEIPGVDISKSNENIVAYVNILSRIRVFYETDIQVMLNSSIDRNRTLNDFIAGMKSVSLEASDSLKAIGERKSVLQSEFDAVTAEKQMQEDQYFANLAANNPNETSQNLINFTELARKSVDIRARFRALTKVEEYMNRYSNAINTRIRDVEFNREALIKGVKVIDVEGSDIDLIIPESDL